MKSARQSQAWLEILALAVLSSWGDTLDDADVLERLKNWNEVGGRSCRITRCDNRRLTTHRKG